MAEIKAFESLDTKLDNKRKAHLELNEKFDSALKQMQLKHNNGGSVSDSEVNDILSLMAVMTDDRRDINKLAERAGEDVSSSSKYEKALDDFLDEHL